MTINRDRERDYIVILLNFEQQVFQVNTPIKLGIIKTIRCAIILNDKTYICDKYQTYQHPYSHDFNMLC